jgi:hypothetical protein
MTAKVRRSRVAKGPTTEKLAITLPRELAEAVRSEARATSAPSLSAYIAQALAEKLEGDRLQEVLDDIFRDQPMTDEERAWADRLLTAR